MSDQPGIIRNLCAKLLGRSLVEGPLLPFIQQERENARSGLPPTAYVAQKILGGAVVGLASTRPDPLWPETSILDIYCHSEHWYLADELLKPLVNTGFQRLVAHVENGFTQKEHALIAAGFRQTGGLAKQLARPSEPGIRDDVGVYELLD
jgi:hypothetical protein